MVRAHLRKITLGSWPGRASLVAISLVMASTLIFPALVYADTITAMRPVADTYNNWLVKPGSGTSQAWAAIDDPVSEGVSVPATDWLWAGGAGRVAEVALSYPEFNGMQPMNAAVKFYANTGASTQLRVETVACGTVRASMTVPAGQGFGWRSLNTSAAKLYCGQTGQDQRLRLRFTAIGGGDSNIRAAYVSASLAASPKVASVMAYNVAGHTVESQLNTNFQAVINTINSKSPDIVLLSEVRHETHFLRPQPNPIPYLASKTGHAYFDYEATTATGATGYKGVAILSRYPITARQYHQVPVGGSSFGVLQNTLNVNGQLVEVFSARFSPMHRLWPDGPKDTSYDSNEWPSNEAGHTMMKQLVRNIPANRPVIVGGDFNATWRHAYAGAWPADTQTPWTVNFRDTSGLKDSLVEYERPYGGGWDGRVDYIYYRGPYIAKTAALQTGYPGASDHSYAFTELGFSQVIAQEMATSGGGSMDY